MLTASSPGAPGLCILSPQGCSDTRVVEQLGDRRVRSSGSEASSLVIIGLGAFFVYSSIHVSASIHRQSLNGAPIDRMSVHHTFTFNFSNIRYFPKMVS
jgi:hypothetical protein